MLKKENKCITLLSIVLVGILFSSWNLYTNYLIIYIFVLPVYIFVIFLINRHSLSQERIDFAINICLEESEFNVIDQIEKLRNYFKDTKDVIKYLTYVDSRVLVYVFHESNKELSCKEYITGAIKCLTIFKNYSGTCYFDIDIFCIPDENRISTLLSTLYLVSKLIDKKSSSIYIQSRQNNSGVTIDVIDDNTSSMTQDMFFVKLLNIFSSTHFELSSKVI